MAYWITHLRVADAVIQKLNLYVNMENYLVGSIATDSGMPVFTDNGKKSYIPPRAVSHWTDVPSNWDSPIHYSRFYNAYVSNETDLDKKSFYLGYFVHLLTDMLWIELISRPVIESFSSHDDYALCGRSRARQDWMENEQIYLQNNPDFRPLKTLQSIQSFENVYLDYFPPEAIQVKIGQVIDTYKDSSVDAAKVHPYVSFERYEQAVDVIIRLIIANLLSR
ncbi:MAG: zinc dependent phospholipase C family protein [Bacillota bacterium]|nr:zinc dependent phospholipase C family protein [Bacillota bacterium]